MPWHIRSMENLKSMFSMNRPGENYWFIFGECFIIRGSSPGERYVQEVNTFLPSLRFDANRIWERASIGLFQSLMPPSVQGKYRVNILQVSSSVFFP